MSTTEQKFLELWDTTEWLIKHVNALKRQQAKTDQRLAKLEGQLPESDGLRKVLEEERLARELESISSLGGEIT